MPIITVKLIENVFDAEQKQQMIEKLTDAMVAIEGEAMRPVTWVAIEEVREQQFGIGGKPMSATDIHALQRSGAAA